MVSTIILQMMGLTHREIERISEVYDLWDETLWSQLSADDFRSVGIADEKVSKVLDRRWRIQLPRIERVIHEQEISLLFRSDSLYPSLLREIGRPPFFLSLRWTAPGNRPLISIVGSRKATRYSENLLRSVIPQLVEAGYGIVSGGARGVDALSHKIALECGGYTIAVVGTGIDRAYPSEHRALFDQIAHSGGAVISHFPLGAGAEPYHFPIRNELIAGLSRGLIVTEAGDKSGTLITARLALDFSRDVFAFPGDIGRESSVGTNALIRKGEAQLVTNASDILDAYGESISSSAERSTSQAPHIEDPLQLLLYESLTESLTVSELLDRSGRESSEVSLALSMLEIMGHVRRDFEGRYERL